jgi:hypothetical protein|tara:strand:+ start:3198 stop:3659 length:462 start_codon:yes stop_codon:yes gene_type:complete
MVETRERSGYTGRKRGRRGGFRNPAFREMVRNGEISPSAEITPDTSARQSGSLDLDGARGYRRKTYAQMETLLNYFNEDWFDFNGFIKDETEEIGRKRTGSSSKMFKCFSCDRPWSPGLEVKSEYYDKSLFKNIPMEKKLCRECDDALPVVAD